MLPIDYENVNLATDLVQIHRQHLEIVAWQSIHEFAFGPSELVLICAAYCPLWKKLIKSLHPKAVEDAVEIQERGFTPSTVACIDLELLEELLSHTKTDIIIPEDNPKEGMIWLLVLHAKDHLWLQLPLIAPKKLDS